MFGIARLRDYCFPALNEVEVFADQHRFAVLVGYFEALYYNAVVVALWVRPFFFDGSLYLDSVADKDRPDKPEPVVAVGHGVRINIPGGQAHRHAENEGAVRDTLPDSASM